MSTIYKLKFEAPSNYPFNKCVDPNKEEFLVKSQGSVNSNITPSINNRPSTQKLGRKPKDPYETQKQNILTDMKDYIDQKGGLISLKGVPVILEIMKRESMAETRIIPLQILNLTDNAEVIKEFMSQQGIFILTEWVSSYKDLIETQNNLETKDYDLLNHILNLSNKMPIKTKDLKSTKFGKQINKLGKCIKDPKIKGKCESIVDRWRKMISDQKEKSQKSSNYENKKGKEENLKATNDNKSPNSYQPTKYSQPNHFSSSTSQDNHQLLTKKRDNKSDFEELDKNNKKYNSKLILRLISFVFNITSKLLFVS